MSEPEPQPEGAAATAWHWDQSHLEARAARVKMNAEGGFEWPLACEDTPGATPAEGLSDPYIDNFLAAQATQFGLDGLLMIITRTDNSNVVIYKVRPLQPTRTTRRLVHHEHCSCAHLTTGEYHGRENLR